MEKWIPGKASFPQLTGSRCVESRIAAGRGERKFLMKIEDKAFVAIQFGVCLDSGEEIDRTEPGQPLSFVFNTGQMLPGVEKRLDGQEVGHKTRFSVEPQDGYGMPRPELVRQVPLSDFPPDQKINPGMAFEINTPRGKLSFIVKSVEKDVVTIDFNNPLCGERLRFDIEVVEVRQATEEELTPASSGCQCSHDHDGCGSGHDNDGCGSCH